MRMNRKKTEESTKRSALCRVEERDLVDGKSPQKSRERQKDKHSLPATRKGEEAR